ncbi:MAG: winged helix-turn-helix transcriptional regulator [Thermoplasmata archaeon]|nr:MAG: winged helix-turn-helix transcriptional regulator [Thermoplasmata archaeon]
MKILRDLRLSTELLILLEVIKNPHIRLKIIAEKLGITVQGASDYLRRMKKEGYIQNIGGELRATKEGIEFLHTNFAELKSFVDLKIIELNIIDVCAAIAKNKIKEGDEVGLFMEKGVLTAYSKRKSKSKGIALSDAEIDEDVAIKELEGMVSLSPGSIHVVKLPSIREGGSKSTSIQWVRGLHNKLQPDKVGAMDVVSIAVLKKAAIMPDFDFAPMDSSIEAVEKGLDVLLFASGDQVHNVVSTIEEINSTVKNKIRYDILTEEK